MNEIKHILLLEDDVVDVMTTRRAFKELEIAEKLHVGNNGEEGLSFLNDPAQPLPDLILLDIYMPRMNGHEFLREIKHDERFRRIPIVVLTTSKEDGDRLESFNTGVAGYIIKPVSYAKFVEALSQIHSYWSLNQLPEEESE